MIQLNIPKELKIKVWNYLQDNNIGQRGNADGNQEEQYVGLLGEYTIKYYLGMKMDFAGGFDGGFDLVDADERKWDVKTMGRTIEPKPHYVNNLIASQVNYDCDYYLFCSLNKRTSVLTVCGYISTDDFKKIATFNHKGKKIVRDDGTSFKMKTDNYTIANQDLREVFALEELFI
jgi:hypothetical protein